MSVTSKDMKDDKVIESKGRAPDIGLISGEAIERAFIRALYVTAAALALLSVIGTFYGMRGTPAPLAQPLTLIADATAAPTWLLVALSVQGVLTLAQWAARQLARRNTRWWLLYLAVLGLSVYYNAVAYFGPAVALGVPWLLAAVLILGGDAAPELIVVRQKKR